MMSRISIRLRLTLWYSGVLLFGLALFGAAWWFALQQRLIAGVDRELAQRADGMRAVLQIESSEHTARGQLEEELKEFAQEVPGGSLIQIRDQAGRTVLSGDPTLSFPSETEPRYETRQFRGRPVRVFTTRISYRDLTYDVLTASPLDEVQGLTRDLRNLLLLTVPGVLLVACLGGYWISRRALAPVDEMSAAARLISVQNLSHRLAVPPTGDELQRLSETWNTMLDRLEAAVGRITAFTADASHELRTPISLIRATADLALRREREPQQYRQALQEIVAEADRMTRLTENLLTLARSDSGALELPLSPVDVHHTVEEVVSQSQALANLRGVELTACLNGGRPAVVANGTSLRRVLVILIDNALKHTPSGGRVTVSADEKPGSVTLAVEDSGEGIEPSELPHIFERFYRADPARHRNGGVGLGLSIAQTIARAHGAEIRVESAPGLGTRFEMTLPASPSGVR